MLLVDSVLVVRIGDEFFVSYAADISANMERMTEVGEDIPEPKFFPPGAKNKLSGEEQVAEVPIVLDDHHAKLLAGLEMMQQAILEDSGSTTISAMFEEFANTFFNAGVKYGWQDASKRPRES